MASRKEEKEALREERLAREREAASGERRRRMLGYGVGAAIAVAALVAIVLVALAPGAQESSSNSSGQQADWPEGSAPPATPLSRDLPGAAKAAGCTVASPKNEGSTHVSTPVRYKANPPTSGNHNPEAAADGAYLAAPGKVENLIHDLEHGRIHMQFRPNAPDRVKGNLKALFDEDPYHMLLTPNVTKMTYEVAATTWGHSLTCPGENPKVYDAIRAFTRAYRDRGPEYVP